MPIGLGWRVVNSPRIGLTGKEALSYFQIETPIFRNSRKGGVEHLKKTARSGTEAAKHNKVKEY
jgi:hypothetical protein